MLIFHNQEDYPLLKNKDNSVTLYEPDGIVPLLTITTDYKVYQIPTCQLVGRIDCDGQYLVFKPTSGKVLRSDRFTATPEHILDFHRDIARWWLNLNKSN